MGFDKEVLTGAHKIFTGEHETLCQLILTDVHDIRDGAHKMPY